MKLPRLDVVAWVAIFLFAVLSWRIVESFRMSLQLAFADEQTEVFSVMVEKALAAVRRDPPDVKSAVGCLGYVHRYYPSGTKQSHGSDLDRIVERSRKAAERQIMDAVRAATDVDYGAKVDDWIRE